MNTVPLFWNGISGIFKILKGTIPFKALRICKILMKFGQSKLELKRDM
jgi:hypothetical protein